jgi:hypothetical protein
MAKRTSKGTCNFCGETFSKSVMTRHVESCRQKEVDSETSSSGQSPRKSDVFHLVVEGRYAPEYWMHLEVPAGATLEDLDDFLRDTWLECCGHLSAFRIAQKVYSVRPMEDFDDEGMEASLGKVLSPGMKFGHEYDFGSTTHLALTVLSREQRQIKSKSIAVLARNEAPEYTCMSCGKVAVHVCTECICSGEGCLCDECAAEHECGEEMLLPLVNSPRAGVCGYTGQ